MARKKLCRWKCGRETDRRCGICLTCCNERDERNKRIDAGLEAYIPPDQRPGHRIYRTLDQKAAFKVRGQKAKATKAGRGYVETAQGEA